MKGAAIAASLALPVLLSGCFSSLDADRGVAAPAPALVERRVTTTTETVAPAYAVPGTVTTTTSRETVVRTRSDPLSP